MMRLLVELGDIGADHLRIDNVSNGSVRNGVVSIAIEALRVVLRAHKESHLRVEAREDILKSQFDGWNLLCDSDLHLTFTQTITDNNDATGGSLGFFCFLGNVSDSTTEASRRDAFTTRLLLNMGEFVKVLRNF